jgi:periplasmic copper chaperone A
MRRPALLAALALLAAAATAAAQTAGPLMISEAWSRPAVQGANAVGYMTVMNHGPAAAALVKVESPLAAKVEIHRSHLAAGVMSMSAEPRVDVPPAGMVSFAPGGRHLMFFGISRTLKAGDRLPATLTFDGGRQIKVAFAVGAGAGAPASDHTDHKGR